MKRALFGVRLAAVARGPPLRAHAQQLGQGGLPSGDPCYQGGACNIGGAPLRAGNIFIQSYGTEPMQSQFWGYLAGAAYPATDSGFGTIGIGVSALQHLTSAGNENVAVGPLAAQMATTISLSTALGMHALGSQLTGAGYTALGNDAMRDAIATAGYVTAVGQGAAAHGGFGAVTAVGALAAQGNSSVVVFSGSPTTGDVVSLTLSSSVSGLTGLPLTVQHTVAGGDTLNSVATALANAIGQNIGGPSYQTGAVVTSLPDGTVALSVNFPGTGTTGWAITITPSVTGAATEVLTVHTGQNGNQLNAFGNKALQAPAGYNLYADAAFGDAAGQYMTSGQYNALFGYSTGQNITSGSSNAIFGVNGMQNATTGTANAGVGFWVLKNLTTASQDSALGRQACASVTTGGNNVCVGYAVGSATLQTGNGNILIGSGARSVDTATSSTSNTINIENILTVTGTNTASTSAAQFAGTLNVVGGYISNGTAGVTCSGTPTASFASTNGIVTHC